MATENVMKTRLEVSGEAEYKRACKDISSSLKVINSEMKLVTAEFANNAKSTRALTAKQDVLNKKYDEQEKKVKAAEEALETMREAGIDPTSSAYQKMVVELNKAKAELARVRNELEDTNKELKESEKKTKSSKEGWANFGKAVATAGEAFGTVLAALGTAATVAATALAGLTVSASDYADELLTQSTFTRQSTDELQKYAYASRFVDVELSTLTSSMKKNVKAMDNARKGSKEYEKAYAALGVSVADASGELRDSNEVYWECIDALGEIENETERDALAMQIFGKSATDLNSVIEAGSEEFKNLGKEAEELGFILSEEAVASLGVFNDKLQVLDASTEGVKNSMSLVALPFLDKLADDGIPIMTRFSKSVSDASGDISQIGGAIGEAFSSVLNLINENTPALLEMGMSIVMSIVKGITENSEEFKETVLRVGEMLVVSMQEMLPTLVQLAVDLLVAVVQGITSFLPSIIPVLIDAVFMLVTALLEATPEIVLAIVECIPQIINGICTALTSNVDVMIDAYIQLFGALIQALPQILLAIVKACFEVVAGICGTFQQLGYKLTEVGSDMLKRIWDGISSTASWLWEKVSGWASGLIDDVKSFFGIHSPSTVFAGIGENMALGVGEGFASEMDGVNSSIVDAMSGTAGETAGAVSDSFNAQSQVLQQAGTDFDKMYADGMVSGIPLITGKIPQIVQSIVTAFRSDLNSFRQIGVDISLGLWDGIFSKQSWLNSMVRDAIKKIIRTAKAAADEHSPSKEFAKIGAYMAEGLGVGFSSEIGSVERMIRRDTQSLINASRDSVSDNEGSAGGTTFNVTQNIYANETSYAEQQRQAARQFKQFARGVMA